MSSGSEPVVKSADSNPLMTTLGKYQIERKLGQGGMGTVYLARNTDLKKLVALKVLPRDKAKNPILVRRFKAEAQAAGQLEHPNIVAVYDTGEADGYLYIAMEYVDGIDLFEQVKRRGTIPVKRSIDIIKQVASALQHAFEHNIVHRDIKPSNLLLKHDGTVKVTDLGLARSIDDTLETDITRAGTTVGTVDYMAPEQARNSKAADIRSDIYSLGCTWYQMLTGDPPFPEGSLTNKLQAHAIKPLPDPREFNENVPEGVFAVLQRMTEKKPADRYQTPADLLDDLENSKLTHAAFSNEIFSDLSDAEIETVKDIPPADDAEIAEAEEPRTTPRRRRSRSAEEEEGDEPVRPVARRKPAKQNDDEVEEEEPKRRSQRRSRSAKPADPAEELTENRPRSKTGPSRSRVEQSDESDRDDEIEERQFRRTGSDRTTTDRNNTDRYPADRPNADRNALDRHTLDRNEPEIGDDPVDDPSSSKRKRKSTDEERSDPAVVKNAKGMPSVAGREKAATKHIPKPLPPKRQPLPPAEEQQSSINLEPVKYAGLAAAVLGLIGGLSWLIFQWGHQVDTASNPYVEPVPTVVANSAVAPKRVETPTEDPTVSVTVVDPAKTGSGTDQGASEFDIARIPLPDWSKLATEPSDLPLFTVGPGGTSANHFSSLDDALKSASNTGGLIRLMGNGPFVLSSATAIHGKNIVITTAAATDRPLVVVTPGSAESKSGLVLSNGMLDLRGIHFVLDRTSDVVPTGVSMFSVIDGQLFVRNCSFTATGQDQKRADALTFGSEQDSQNIPAIEPRLLLDHVTIRGNGLTGVRIDRTMAEAIIQDSLLVTGTSPALQVSGSVIVGADASNSSPRRIIRVLRSTLCGRRQVFELAADTSGKPPTTAFFLQDSICTAEGAGNNAVLVAATRWPSVTSTSSGWLTNLSWTSESTLYIGFERLMDLDKSGFKVAALDAWQRVWGKKFNPRQFQPFVWPDSLIADLSAVQPHDFDSTRLPYREIQTSRGNLPGCSSSQLTVPGTISQTRLAALAHRPAIPASVLKPEDPPFTKQVNLAREDLGVVINRNDWPSGTLFEVTGAGLQMMQPARITGKTLRIIFRQGDGGPFRLQPKLPESKGKLDAAALFTIEKGTLELQSASLEASSNSRATPLPWLIQATDSTVILRGCQLNGPTLQDMPQHQGLIWWKSTSTATENSPEPNLILVSDSVLFSTGVGIRTESVSGQVIVNNSIIGVRGDGIDLHPIRSGTSLLPVVDLQQSTFSTSRAAIRIHAAAGNDPVTVPMRLFVDSCAFVSPLEFRKDESDQSSVLELMGPVLEQKQVEWWGTSNGFAREWNSFLRQSEKAPVTSATGWMDTWGSANDARLLTGPKGVHLKTPLPTKWPQLKASSFQLDPSSAAATWGTNGHAVGADIRVVEEQVAGRKGPAETKSAAQGNKPTTSPQVGGKKNVGF